MEGFGQFGRAVVRTLWMEGRTCIRASLPIDPIPRQKKRSDGALRQISTVLEIVGCTDFVSQLHNARRIYSTYHTDSGRILAAFSQPALGPHFQFNDQLVSEPSEGVHRDAGAHHLYDDGRCGVCPAALDWAGPSYSTGVVTVH